MSRFNLIADAVRARARSLPLALVCSEEHVAIADVLGATWHPWPRKEVLRRLSPYAIYSILRDCFAAQGSGCCVVIPPDMSGGESDQLDRAAVARLAVAVSDGMQSLISRGIRLIVIDERALDRAETAAFSVPTETLAGLGRSCADGYTQKSMSVVQANHKFQLPAVTWEVETTDLSSDDVVQLPGGEVFAHFACAWTGELDIAIPCQGRWLQPRLHLHNGRVVDVTDDGVSVCDGLLGWRVCEVGVGTNPFVTRSPEPWVEKAAGLVHLGLGCRLGNDVAPPTVHTDVVLTNASLR